MGQAIVQVDAFARRPFEGNPAAICVLEEEADADWMQRVALEMNLSETAYLVPMADGFGLRWFTPTHEVDLCGHATLASAHVLWESGRVPSDAPCVFHTRSGVLTARKSGTAIELEFPLETHEPLATPQGLAGALDVEPVAVALSERLSFLIVEVADESAVRKCSPDFSALKQLPYGGYMVTSRADAPPYDVVSRFFAPGLGIDEDPVTGAAHGVLAPYWCAKLNTDRFLAYQASARGGEVHVRLDGSRVMLGGQAVTVLRGELV